MEDMKLHFKKKSRPNQLIYPTVFTQTTLEKGIDRYTVTMSTLAGTVAQQEEVCRAIQLVLFSLHSQRVVCEASQSKVRWG